MLPGMAHQRGGPHVHPPGHENPHDHRHDHPHGPGHQHGHGHRHQHGPARPDRAFAIAAAFNFGFVITEVAAGLLANSVALVADALHNLSDVGSLLLGWGALWLSRRKPTSRRTYGWGRSSIMASLVSAVILLISVGAIAVEAIDRFSAPQPVQTGFVMAVAGIGILINAGTALLFLRGRDQDLNIRAQFLHLGADAAVSLAVVLSAAAIVLTGQAWIDPLMSLIVVAVIVISTWGLLRESMDLAMDAVPERVRETEVHDWLVAVPGVIEVHDLHIWGLSTTETALTAHLVLRDDAPEHRPHVLAAGLRDRFAIGHVTLQVERAGDAALCWLRPADVV
jgi:cobalt-zinc-cadmium efflux system protein